MLEAVEILKDVDSAVDLGLEPTGKSLGKLKNISNFSKYDI